MHIAQLNIAYVKAPLESELMRGFVDNLDRINALAEASPGFVWRLEDDSGNATGFGLLEEPDAVVNLSVWESIETLRDFVLKTDHAAFLKRRGEWFHKPELATAVLWNIPVGDVPTLEEAYQRLLHLREHGDSDFAFGVGGSLYATRT